MRTQTVKILATARGFWRLLYLSATILSGMSAQAQVTYFPTTGVVSNGQALYGTGGALCSGCHGATANFNIGIRNAANAGRYINLAMARGMGGYTAGSYNNTQENDLAAYIATLFVTSPLPNGQSVPFNSAGTAVALPNIFFASLYATYNCPFHAPLQD